MTRRALTHREETELLAQASGEVRYRDLHEDLQVAADQMGPSAARVARYLDVGEVPVEWFHAETPRITSLDVFWKLERDVNLRTAAKYEGFLTELRARLDRRGKKVGKRLTARDATVEDVKAAFLYCIHETENFQRDGQGFPEDFDAPTEFGRIIGIMRWLDQIDVNEMTPVLATVAVDRLDGRTRRLYLLDGWHRMCVALIRKWSTIRTILMVPP